VNRTGFLEEVDIMVYTSSLTLEEKLACLSQADPVLSIQFFETFRRKNHLEPEKVLMFAVLKDAVECVQKYAGSSWGKGKRLFGEARDWILRDDDDDDWPFSFNSICGALGLAPSYLRRALSDMMEQELVKARIRELKSQRSVKRKAKDRKALKSLRKAGPLGLLPAHSSFMS
jgi:hypothetical protein